MNKIKQNISEELAKLKPMDAAQKREYIWEYYKIHFFVFVFILVFTLAILDVLVFNPQKTTFLGVAIFGPYVDPEICLDIEKRLETALMPEIYADNSKINVTNFYVDDQQGQMYYASLEKFVAMIQAGEIDIFIASFDSLQQYTAGDFLHDLSALDIDYPTDRMLYFDINHDDEIIKRLPLAAPLIDSDFFDYDHFASEHLYIGIIINAPRIDTAAEMINLVLLSK